MNVERAPFRSKRHDPYLQSAEINLTIFRIEEPHANSSQSAQVKTPNTPDSSCTSSLCYRGLNNEPISCYKTCPLPQIRLNQSASP